jgi:dihydroxy-acid dehydratase
MLSRNHIDIPLLIISALLVLTLMAFLTGLLPYPFGFFILGLALLGRILQLRSMK